MAQTGKKINELTAITTVSNETVLPAVYVSGGNASSTANKVSIEQISNKITEDISTVLEGKQDKLTAGDNITIENNVISAEVPSLPENVYTEDNLVAGDGITLTKEDDVTTITATAQVPDNVWTQDNLKAGDNVTITQVEKPLIDNNTVALFHFDNNANNEINNNYVVDSSLQPFAFDSTNYKFGGYSAYSPTSSNSAITSSTTGITGDFTIDFWGRHPGTSTTVRAIVYINGSSMYSIYPYKNSTSARIQINNNTGGETIVDTSKFNHFAIVHKDSHPYFFINGKLVYSNTSSTYSNPTDSLKMQISYASSNPFLVDELRVSNIARWTSDFTPYNEPYAHAGGPIEYQINAVIPQGAPTLTWYTNVTGTTVTIANTTGANLVKIYKNGLLLEPTADYSISGTTLTMVTALVATDKITTEVF